MTEEILKQNGAETEAETGTEISQTDYEWPEDRFRELEPGQVIEAKVILVRDDAAFVDIGGKSDLTIPLAELTVEPVASAKQVVQVGDVIKVMVTRTGDEDRILLSKRLLDQEKVWFELEEAAKQGQVLQGTVTAVVKGGLSVNLSGIKAFMPASQAGLGVKNLEEMVGQTYQLQILELDLNKKRVLVSRRALLEAEKKQAEAEFFSNIKEGERKKGVVTRLTDFGAFVDLGSGVEGLIHISELSWNRVKSPKDLLKEGDQVEVIVIKVEPETKRISLSLKQIQAHPWDEAIQKFSENGTYPGEVTRLEPFGAFIRLAPGIEGLAHISQLSDKRVSKPDEVVKVGDQVQAKVLKIDRTARKVSLSLNAVKEAEDQKEVQDYLGNQNEEKFAQSLGDLLKK